MFRIKKTQIRSPAKQNPVQGSSYNNYLADAMSAGTLHFHSFLKT
jgi:hypothetical protein